MDIPDEVRRALREFVAKLEPQCRGARWTRLEGIHVTLKFIGEASPEKVEFIKRALSGVQSASAVEMTFRGVGFFPNAKHARVLWAGIEATANLAELAAEIEKRMEHLGIRREGRAFHPHLTLARFKSEEGLAHLHETLEKLGAAEFGRMQSGEFHLYESRLKPGGAEYSKLASFPFVEGK